VLISVRFSSWHSEEKAATPPPAACETEAESPHANLRGPYWREGSEGPDPQ